NKSLAAGAVNWRRICSRQEFPTAGLRNPAFGPSLVGIGDKAGSPSDGPSVQALRTTRRVEDCAWTGTGRYFLFPQISFDRFLRRVFPRGRDAVRIRANRS